MAFRKNSIDSRLEETMSKWLDFYFYSVLNDEYGIPCYRTIPCGELQKLGVDKIVNGKNVDEKLKIKSGFLNRILEYPSFELSRIQNDGIRKYGWFLDKRNITDCYAFIAAFTDVNDVVSVGYDNIVSANILFVNREDIKRYIETKGTNIEEAEREFLNKHDIDGNDRFDFPHRCFHLKFSSQLEEQPINLVIKRTILKSFENTKEFNVTKSSISEI